MLKTTKFLTRTGAIAGLYAVLSLLTLPISSGVIQCRVSEGLSLLPLLFPESAVGLFIGCLLSNILTGCAVWDVFLGSLVTLICAIFTALVGKYIKNSALKIILGGLFPVVLNALILPLVWILCYGALSYVYLTQCAILFLGQAVSVYGIGTPLYLALKTLSTKNLLK